MALRASTRFACSASRSAAFCSISSAIVSVGAACSVPTSPASSTCVGAVRDPRRQRDHALRRVRGHRDHDVGHDSLWHAQADCARPWRVGRWPAPHADERPEAWVSDPRPPSRRQPRAWAALGVAPIRGGTSRAARWRAVAAGCRSGSPRCCPVRRCRRRRTA